MNRKAEVDRGAEVIWDWIVSFADGKDDDEFVFVESAWHAMGEACGVDVSDQEIPPITAGELRRRGREVKAALARGEGPGR